MAAMNKSDYFYTFEEPENAQEELFDENPFKLVIEDEKEVKILAYLDSIGLRISAPNERASNYFGRRRCESFLLMRNKESSTSVNSSASSSENINLDDLSPNLNLRSSSILSRRKFTN